jgi:hypothetical protein
MLMGGNITDLYAASRMFLFPLEARWLCNLREGSVFGNQQYGRSNKMKKQSRVHVGLCLS